MPYDLRQTCARMRGRSGREVSGQYRVTIPDPDALDRLRTQNRVYYHTLMPRDRFAGSVPSGYAHYQVNRGSLRQNLWIQTRGAKTTRKIVESVRVARGWVHSDSEGYLLDTHSPLLTARSKREGPESMATRGETLGGNPRRSQSVTESLTLLQIPLCVTAVLQKTGIRAFADQRWWILRTTWIRGRTQKGLALRLNLDLAPRRSLRRPKDFRDGQISTCP